MSESDRNTEHTYILEKPKIQGNQKWYSGLSNAQIRKYKDTNTQIHCDEAPEIPNMWYILEKPGVKLWITDPLTNLYTVPPDLFALLIVVFVKTALFFKKLSLFI